MERNSTEWKRFLEQQRRKLQQRSTEALGHSLTGPMPGESLEKVERVAQEDVRRAKEGLVPLLLEGRELSYKHIDELAPEDRRAVQEAEIARLAWLSERAKKKGLRLNIPATPRGGPAPRTSPRSR